MPLDTQLQPLPPRGSANLGSVSGDIYRDLVIPDWPGQAPQQARGQAGPNAALLRLGLEEQENDQIRQLAQQYGDDPDELVRQIGRFNPEKAYKISEQIGKATKEGAEAHLQQTKAAREELQSRLSVLQGADATNWDAVTGGIVKDYPQLTPLFAGRPYSDEFKQQILNVGRSQDQWLDAQEKAATDMLDEKKQLAAARLIVAADTPQKQAELQGLAKQGGFTRLLGMFDPQSAQAFIASQQKAEAERKPPTVGSFEDYMTADPAHRAQILVDRKAYNQADDKPPRLNVSVNGPGGPSDVKETILGMKDGTLPPVMPGRGSKEYTALMAEAHRQGFDLSKANQDWVATQKYLGTLNGAQQTRLRQATQQVSDSVPLIRGMVKEWDSYGIPLLSKANLESAKSGAYGNKAQSLARRLDAQIADITSELGTVYKGGNSSTDESLKLAAKNLGADWSKKAALDALDQIEKNVAIRQHSMRLPPVTGHESNAYAPEGLTVGATPPAETPPPSGGMVWMRAPKTGQMKQVPASEVDRYRAAGAVVVKK